MCFIILGFFWILVWEQKLENVESLPNNSVIVTSGLYHKISDKMYHKNEGFNNSDTTNWKSIDISPSTFICESALAYITNLQQYKDHKNKCRMQYYTDNKHKFIFYR